MPIHLSDSGSVLNFGAGDIAIGFVVRDGKGELFFGSIEPGEIGRDCSDVNTTDSAVKALIQFDSIESLDVFFNCLEGLRALMIYKDMKA